MYPEVSRDCIYNAAARHAVGAAPWTVLISMLLLVSNLAENFVPERFRLLLATLLIGSLVQAYLYEYRKIRARKCSFEEKLRPELELKYERGFDHSCRVAISPGHRIKDYRGDVAWDVGYIETGGGISFYGDQSSFSLPRGYIVSVHQPRLGTSRLVVRYEVAGKPTQTLLIFPRAVGSSAEAKMALQRLRTRLALTARPLLPLELVPPPLSG